MIMAATITAEMTTAVRGAAMMTAGTTITKTTAGTAAVVETTTAATIELIGNVRQPDYGFCAFFGTCFFRA